MPRLVLVRHGESEWNKENLFTGWADVDLSQQGVQEAEKAGKILSQEGFSFDLAFTSMLKRAIRTLWIIQDRMDLMWIPVQISWRLNERHYGTLQGLNKSETAAKFGEEQVLKWRRSYEISPPALKKTDERYPGNDPKYRHLDEKDIPLTECLKDTVNRLLPYWHDVMAPAIRRGKRVIVSAHGNSIRALVKYLRDVSDQDILGLNIPTGIPCVYELDGRMKAVDNYYLGGLDEVKSATEAVARQGRL